MQELFTTLTGALEGAPAIAMGAAFVWGVLSVLLSPCHLSSIPLIVGFVNGQGVSTARRAFLVSLAFAAGILTTLCAIGYITYQIGGVMGDLGGWANYVVAGLFFLVGLVLLDVIPMPWSGPAQVGMKRKGLLAAFLLGLLLGVALGPCTFTYMIPLLAVTIFKPAAAPAWSGLLLGVYGVGHCAVIVLAGTSSGWVQAYLHWNEKSKGAVILKRICGLLVLAAGVYLIYLAK